MMEFCQKYGLHYLSDEVFANTVFDEADAFVSALELVRGGDGDDDNGSGSGSIDPNLVHVVWSTSKDFGACGIRSVSIYITFLSLRKEKCIQTNAEENEPHRAVQCHTTHSSYQASPTQHSGKCPP